MITLCMIVKNEENNIEKCLKVVSGLVDEIVIVDTGSTDNTKKIASKFTNKIFDFEWCNDFSKARNFSISKANNDWILVLDGDEIVEEYNKNKVEKFILNNDKVVGRIERINIFEDDKGIKKHIERVNRLFNKKFYQYEGIIHEQIASKDNNAYKTLNVDIIVNHLGYTKEIINITKKIDRNRELLEEAILNNSNDQYLYYQLGKTYFMAKDYSKAKTNFEKALNMDIDFKLEYIKDLIISYGYSLINTNSIKEALIIKNYEIYFSSSVDFNFLLAHINMNNGKFQDAVDYFKKCIGKNKGDIEGINSYLPNYNIGVIYECLGYIDEAAKYYCASKNYEPSKNRLSTIFNNENRR